MISMLSIVTAVHNSLAMNQLYWEMLSENTLCPFELILIDNHSTDGSEKYFANLAAKSKAVVHVRNDYNQSYPASQNQGMKLARYDVLCFLNNDIWLPKGWHEPFQKKLSENPLLVLSPSGQEAQPTQTASTQLKLKWKNIQTVSKIWKFLFRKSETERLWKSLLWMYGSLNPFHNPTQSELEMMPGIKGDVVIFHRKLLEKVTGIWDERIEAADWHLYITIAALHEKNSEIPLPQILLNTYAHHFGRYSAKQKFEPMKLTAPFESLESRWGEETIQRLWWGSHLPS